MMDSLADILLLTGLGAAAAGIQALRVTLHESHVAWAAYEGDPRQRP